ncbi:MAG: DNA-directed RNA polymerase subunit beta [Hydrogenibacillus sp.]|nr:DNA-directed RNA polymerase subunit beta [Hydrogenibacillus sp.]
MTDGRSNGGRKRSDSRTRNLPRFTWKTYLAVLVVVAAVTFFVGAAAGYAVLGNQPIGEVFSPKTWWHVLAIVFG